ncbi:MAG TPA: alpha/beta fold hydrolase [Dehalococcoidia bacterium]|jgi:proline-specific peptidase|nr:alpha/beta fold hydrolase [Dehalococcoidia bacterium]
MREEEGHIDVPGGQVWYKVVGSGESVPLLTLHGGPGGGHDYLEPLNEIASERPVVFFDQLGCGKSDTPDDVSLWRIDRFVDEVTAVRDALGLDRIHLLGHSWGGWLAIEYMLGAPSGVVSLTLASTSASIPQFVYEAGKLISELPREMAETMRRLEAEGDFENPEFEAGMMEFYKRHLCRLDPWPDPIMRSLENLDGNIVYETMNGPTEFTVIGNMKDWNRIEKLGEIVAPTLITCGRYDELTPACSRTLRQGIMNSRMHVFERSAHMAHLEETESYLQILSEFLRDFDQVG